ncbi:DUF4389 domain-containing protein [Kordiimonas marina]|uniref:DUF4389 domain-containing protein n=1 Tax=Kordiimonas marina TaxID=2872312 RepID=UPI001FF5FCF7|nr:DUF4389 domain-containing protein [Kordiimonas marina]MCJ9428983.1 DUF4389 domain-containing protein [Kordiimonas marina]
MSEETTPTPEGTEAKAPKKKAAPRKRTTTAKKPAAKTTAKTSTAKKAAPKKSAAKPKAAAAKATGATAKAATPPEAEAPKAEAPKAESASADSAAASHTISEDAQEFIAELKEKDWGTYLVRGIFMLVFGFLSWLAISFCFLLAGIQFVILILTGGPNDVVTKAIMTAGNYIADVMAYLSFKTDERPFPLGKPLPVEE